MATAAKNIKNLRSLEKEIRRLKLHAKELEKGIDERLDYLQDNYSSMAMQSVLSGFLQKTGLGGNILNLFVQNNRLLNVLGKLADQLLNKAADGLELVTDKLFNKKTRDDGNPEEKDIV
jgi:hypothetical protein